jgi:glycosyltransferase involved in cell wall biosynthesis
MSNQEHICIAITKSNMGGAQKYVLTLAYELKKKGFEVTVLAGGTGVLFEELEQKSIPYIRLTQSQRDISIIKEIKLALELFKIFKRIKPTILQVNSSKLGGLGALIGRLSGIHKIFFTAHGWAFNEKRSALQKKLLYILYWITIILSTKTICVSNKMKEQISFLPLVKNKLTTIYTGLEVPVFYTRQEARERLHEMFPQLDLRKKWFVTLAELHYTKGHDILIRSVAQTKDIFKNYQFVCIGSGEQKAKLQALIHHKELESSFFLTGFINNAASYLPAFEALILPSRTEAFGLAILESGFAGINVIATNIGGIPEIIEDTVTGLLFEKENTEDLSKKIMELESLDETNKDALRNRLQKSVLKKFSVDTMMSEITHLFNN